MRLRALVPARRDLVAALASAVLFGVAFPPFRLLLPVFVCLVPVGVVAARLADEGASWREAARMGAWFGAVGYGINLYWIAVALAIYTKLAILGLVGALLVLTPMVTATVVILVAARRATRLPMALLLPVTWVALELALNYLGPLAFPWLPLGLALARHPLAIQFADLSGVRGVSFWLAAINGLLVDAWLHRDAWRAVAARLAAIALLVAAALGYGAWRMRTTVMRPLAHVAVVQPNIPQIEKWQRDNRGKIIDILARLSRQAAAEDDPQLLVWPEAALPGFLVNQPNWADTVRDVAASTHTPMIFGVLDVRWLPGGQYQYFNAAMFADAMGRIGVQRTYHKTYLVPIVERVPFLDPRWFAKWNYFGGYSRGGRPHPFVLPFGKVGVLICYESIFPERSRTDRLEGVSLMLNITNDAWFGRSLAPYQHEAHLAFRAIENRVGIVRDANTGISAWVDPLGRFHHETGLFVPAALDFDVRTTNVLTLYDHVGDWVGALSALGTLVLVAVALRRRRTP